MSTNKVVAYLRKSSKDNLSGEANKQLNSFSYQQNVVNDIINKNELDLKHPPFRDDHTGYYAFSRDGFHQMIKVIEDEEIDGIVCYDLSRLARNFGDGGLILWYLQSGRIKSIYTYDKVFTDSHSDQLMVAINFAIAKNSSDQTSDKTKKGIKDKVITTGHPHYPPILGYLGSGKSGKREWIIDPEVAPLVRDLFESYATGTFNLNEITDYAYSIGLRSNTKKRTRMGKNTIRNRLTDIAYTGVFLLEEERIAGKYTPIITPELFYKVQDVIQERSHPKSQHVDYAFSRMITCASCGGNVSGTMKKGITYYRCSKRKEPCKLMKVPYLVESDFLDDFSEALKKIELVDKEWKQLREYVAELNNEDKGKYLQQATMAKSRVLEAEERLKQIGVARMKKEIDKHTADLLSKDAKEQIKVYVLREQRYEKMAEEVEKRMKRFLDDLHHVANRFKSASEENQRTIVSVLCENLVWDGEKVRWDWKKPYYFIAKTDKKSKGLPREDSNLEP
ncbi:recombinase family protein [Candidatus Micrarchaeota archaeon]|nr:recombinase family protein [Candidatus Micrarchaeota archaeon]